MGRIDLSKIDVVDFLNALGIQNIDDGRTEVMFSCPFPGHSHGDSTPSASMSKVPIPNRSGDGEFPPTTFHCFTCGKSGTAITFLAEHENISPLKAALWLREEYGDGFDDPGTEFSKEINELFSKKDEIEQEIVNPTIDENEIKKRQLNWNSYYWGDRNSWPPPVRYMFDRGFSEKILDRHDIGWDDISNRISIPIRNEFFQLVGFKGRLPYDSEDEPKYKVLGGELYGFDTYEVSRILYLLPDALLSTLYLETGSLIVVEGELNALSMHDKGFNNSVGFSGKFLSNYQRELLIKSCKNVILIFDEIEDAERAAQNLVSYMPVSIVPEHDNDPAEMSHDEIKRLITNRYSALLDKRFQT